MILPAIHCRPSSPHEIPHCSHIQGRGPLFSSLTHSTKAHGRSMTLVGPCNTLALRRIVLSTHGTHSCRLIPGEAEASSAACFKPTSVVMGTSAKPTLCHHVLAMIVRGGHLGGLRDLRRSLRLKIWHRRPHGATFPRLYDRHNWEEVQPIMRRWRSW